MNKRKFCVEELPSDRLWSDSLPKACGSNAATRTREILDSAHQRSIMSMAIGCRPEESKSSAKSTLLSSLDSIEAADSRAERNAATNATSASDALWLDANRSDDDAAGSAEGDSEGLVRQKAICVIQSLLTVGFEFTEEVIRQIQSKIDSGESSFLREKITLKILKTKLRKSKRKDKSKAMVGKDSDLNSSNRLPRKQATRESGQLKSALYDLGAMEAEQILHKLISITEKPQESSKPGEHLLSLISPVIKGLYWINNVKFPEIKSIWRRRLLKAHQERRPEGWPQVVPQNYRLTISKRPVQYRNGPIAATLLHQ